ncbi:hypothetical protein [Streptomyces sp. NBC_00557]|uniref:hypothetical protein n=1 Tax=Streptomyces sp. NBC_00557 TaxID=2975776 RepID=UPI002E81A981|nr:hypothetical protein [Streptomyces sp. NBC_00557]WUC35983.1 hypothetical protein OG956_18035 [Streptomyces sp. NBC_00557]
MPTAVTAARPGAVGPSAEDPAQDDEGHRRGRDDAVAARYGSGVRAAGRGGEPQPPDGPAVAPSAAG